MYENCSCLKNKTGDTSLETPISLDSTTVAKMLDCLLNRILNNHVNMNDAQFGFRSRLSKETATGIVA